MPRSIFSPNRWLLGTGDTFVKAPAKNLVGKSGAKTFEHVGKLKDFRGPSNQYFKMTDGGKETFHRYTGKEDLSKLRGDVSRDNAKVKDIITNTSEVTGSEHSKLQKAMHDAHEADQGVLSSMAYNLGAQGGAVGRMARHPIATAGAIGTIALVGETGRRAYKDVQTTNHYRPSTWGIGQNTSVRGDLRKVASIDKFVEKKAGDGIGQYILADALSDAVKGSGQSRGVMGGLGYSISRKLMPLSTRIQMPDTMAESFVKTISTDAGSATFDALNKSMQGVFGRMRERNVDVPKRRAILAEIRRMDPVLQGIPEENLKSWYNTLASYAPNISLDKNMVLSFLKQVAQYDGQIDYGRLKDLMGLEESYQKIHLKVGK